MKLTSDEHRALTFIAALLCLSAAVRFLGLPEPVDVPGGFDLAGHIEAVEAAVAEREAAERPLEPGERIDPNTATAAELGRLPRVGPALAGRIVADREANGRFRRLADLGRVAGIGEKTLEVLAPHVALRVSAGSPAVTPRTRTGRSIPSSPSGSTKAGARLDLNRATAAELEALPGVGPVLAGRIVAFRDSAGGFATVDALLGVKGIGAATLDRLRGRVAVGLRR
jgi:competence ComEA-like helix-hairpin-helix protein